MLNIIKWIDYVLKMLRLTSWIFHWEFQVKNCLELILWCYHIDDDDEEKDEVEAGDDINQVDADGVTRIQLTWFVFIWIMSVAIIQQSDWSIFTNSIADFIEIDPRGQLLTQFRLTFQQNYHFN